MLSISAMVDFDVIKWAVAGGRQLSKGQSCGGVRGRQLSGGCEQYLLLLFFVHASVKREREIENAVKHKAVLNRND